MDAFRAWQRIEEAVRCPSTQSFHLDKFQKLIRKRYRRKKYGSFRVPEYEEILLQNKDLTLRYARCIVRGKLPKNMHRRMLAWGIEDPNNVGIKEYFDVCEGTKNYSRPPSFF